MTRYLTANLTWQWGANREVVTDLAALADVCLFVEARTRDNLPVPIADYLPGFHVVQNTRTAALAGSTLAVRKKGPAELNRARTWLLAAAGHARTSVQDRHLIAGHLIDHDAHDAATVVGVGHFPLATSGQQDDALRSLGGWVDRQHGRHRWVFGGDGNMGAPVLAGKLHAAGHQVDPADADGAHPMVNLWSPYGWHGVHVAKHPHDHIDHDYLVLTES